MSEELTFNGIDATTGEYLIPPVDADTLASAISREPRDSQQEQALKTWWKKYAESNPKKEGHYVAKEGTDYKNLDSAGRGAHFTKNIPAPRATASSRARCTKPRTSGFRATARARDRLTPRWCLTTSCWWAALRTSLTAFRASSMCSTRWS